MPGDNTPVTIVINVVDGTSGAVLSQVVKSLDVLGEAGLRNGQKVKQGLAAVGSAGESVGQQAAKGLRRANGEMQQMLENIQRAQAKLAGAGSQQRISNPLGEAFANIGTARANMEALGNSFATLGTKGAAGASQAGHAVRGVGEHALTSLDNVRLLRDDLGIRIPRSMEKAIASSKVLSGAIGAIGGGLLAFGAIEIFVRLAQQAYEFYKKLTDVNVEMRKFAAEAGQSANQDLFNNSSLETTVLLLQQVQTRKAALEKQRSDAGVGPDNSGSLMQYAGRAFAAFGAGVTPDQKSFKQMVPAFNGDADKRLAGLSNDEEMLRRRDQLLELQRKVQEKQDDVAHAGDGMEGRAANSAKKRAAHDLADAQLQSVQANELYLQAASIRARALEDAQNKLKPEDRTQIYQPSKEAGQYERQRAIQNADKEAGAVDSKQSRSEGSEARHATAEAGMAGLEGEPLHLAQKREELRQLSEKAKEVGIAGDAYNALRRAIETKFNSERKKRQDDEAAQTAQLDAEAGLGGTKGLEKSDKELQARLSELKKEAGKFSRSDTYDIRAADLKRRSDADQAEQQKGFSDRLTDLDAGRADRYSSESDRITLSAQKTVREIQKAWTDLYGGLAAGDARRVQSQQALNAEIVKINADAARQRQEAGQRVEDETSKLEDQARRQSLPKYQQETAAIVDDYNERIRRLEELRARDAENADKYRRQELAEEQIKNGKLLEQRRALADQLAGKLTSLAGNPLEFLKRQGEEAGSKFFADFLLNNKTTQGAATAIANGGKGGALPSIFGSGFGGKHPATFDHGASQAGSGTHNSNPLPATLSKPHIASDSTMLTTSTATINVGTAMFNGVGGTSKASSGRTGSYVPTGNGGFFNLGSGGSGQGIADAGSSSLSTPSSSTSSTSSPDAGSGGGDVFSTVDAGIGTAQSAGSAAKSIGTATGLFKKSGGASSGLKDLGSSAGSDGGDITDEAGASAATDASIGDAGSSAGASAGDAAGAGAGAGAGGAISGGVGLFSAIEGKGGFGGALQGAEAGAQLGASIGGPVGAIIGAVGGAVLGFIGFGARAKAAKYDREKVKPRLANDLRSYEAGQVDYQAMYDDMTTLTLEARQQLKSFGPGANSYYDGTIVPEIKTAQQRLTREAKAGRADYGMSAAQFHTGGFIRDFGSMATSGDQGWIHAQRGEAVLNQQAAMTHADAAMLMNSGASRSQMADYYGGGSSGTQQAAPGSPSEVHLHVHAIDTRGVKQFFDDHKHTLRDSLNASYAENSGGGDYA